MKKRLLCALLAAVMVLSMLPAAFAAAPDQTEAAQVLSALDIMVGDASGNLNLNASVTRAEFVKMLMAASPISVGSVTTISPYPDVPSSHWAAPYVEAAVANGYVNGYLDGTFRPANTITLAEGVTMALRLLGYQDSDFSGSFPAGQIALYQTLDLDEGITLGQSDTMARRDAMYLFYNLLTATTKAGGPYLTTVLGYSLTEDGKIDTLALINSKMDGPTVVGTSGWRESIPFDISTATVNRAGTTTTSAALTTNDVVYWSKSMRTLWVYTNQVTGAIQAVTPTSAPTSITLSGKTYSFETAAAAYSVSDLGTFKVGDPATLLLGRDSKVVAVLPPAQASGTVYGVVTEVKPQTYSDANGHTYTADSLTVMATNGESYFYRYDKTNIKVGAAVQVTSSGDTVSVKSLSTTATLSGRVNAGGTALGSVSFASDVEILDTYAEHAVRVYPARLAGIDIPASAVRYYLLNAQGEISRLILKDVTGDMHTYGVVTKAAEVNVSGALSVSGTYLYDANGVSGSITGSKIYNVKKGPFLLKMDQGEVKQFVNLTSVDITSIDANLAYAGNRQFTLSDDVLVYEVRDNTYFLSSLALVSGGNFSLTGWYDKAENEGGRIRVILAK